MNEIKKNLKSNKDSVKNEIKKNLKNTVNNSIYNELGKIHKYEILRYCISSFIYINYIKCY